MRNLKIIITALTLILSIYAKKDEHKNINSETPFAKFNINNVSTSIYPDGQSDNHLGNSGFIYPIGSQKDVFYESGFIYGGNVNGEWRVGGSTYSQSQLPGRISDNGQIDSNFSSQTIWRVRPDYADPNADYSNEILDEEKTREEIFQQYKNDWENWPAEYGAPYDDVDGNGSYNPSIDIPGVPGRYYK